MARKKKPPPAAHSSRSPAFAKYVTELTNRPVVPEPEVIEGLRRELEAERVAAHSQMVRIISIGLEECQFLSSAVFDPIEEIARFAVRCRQVFNDRRAEGFDERDVRFRVGLAIAEQKEAELRAAIALRAARLPVSHADTPDYWRRARARFSRDRCLIVE
jgi:hypothetical protein